MDDGEDEQKLNYDHLFCLTIRSSRCDAGFDSGQRCNGNGNLVGWGGDDPPCGLETEAQESGEERLCLRVFQISRANMPLVFLRCHLSEVMGAFVHAVKMAEST